MECPSHGMSFSNKREGKEYIGLSLFQVLLQELEQCYYCLYGHPNKRAKIRGLVDHGAEQVFLHRLIPLSSDSSVLFQIPLKWESALMLIEHYHPVPLPSIDDTKSPQVTAEVSTQPVHACVCMHHNSQVISLYKRIITVLPDHGKGHSLLDPYIRVNEYI